MKRNDWLWGIGVAVVFAVFCFIGRNERSSDWLDYGIGFSAGVVGHDGSVLTTSQLRGLVDYWKVSFHYKFPQPSSTCWPMYSPLYPGPEPHEHPE